MHSVALAFAGMLIFVTVGRASFWFDATRLHARISLEYRAVERDLIKAARSRATEENHACNYVKARNTPDWLT